MQLLAALLLLPQSGLCLISHALPCCCAPAGSWCLLQAISNSLWAIATMKRSIQPTQLDQLLQIHLQQLQQPADTPLQCLSNILWAAATLKANVATEVLEAMFDHFAAHMVTAFTAEPGAAEPQSVSNALWAAASLHPPFLPRQLLQDSAAVKFIVEFIAPRMKLQEVTNVILACGVLGFDDAAVLEPLIKLAADVVARQGVERGLGAAGLAGSSSSCSNSGAVDSAVNSNSSSRGTGSGAAERRTGSCSHSSSFPDAAGSTTSSGGTDIQAWCNICWAAAVLDLHSMAPMLLRLAALCVPVWGRLVTADKVQLWQLHMWLGDSGHSGLSDVLGKQQLQDCRAEWVWLVDTESKTSYTQVRTAYERSMDGLRGFWGRQASVVVHGPCMPRAVCWNVFAGCPRLS